MTHKGLMPTPVEERLASFLPLFQFYRLRSLQSVSKHEPVRFTQISSAHATGKKHPLNGGPGYFNFDSMQRLLDLSMSVNVPGERKSFYLEIPSQEGES